MASTLNCTSCESAWYFSIRKPRLLTADNFLRSLEEIKSHRFRVAVDSSLEIVDENLLRVASLVNHVRCIRLSIQLLEILTGQGEGLHGGDDRGGATISYLNLLTQAACILGSDAERIGPQLVEDLFEVSIWIRAVESMHLGVMFRLQLHTSKMTDCKIRGCK